MFYMASTKFSILISILLLPAIIMAGIFHELKNPDQYDPIEGLSPDTPLEQLNFNEFRFHAERKRYFKVGDMHGCSENMRFFAVPTNERLGECDCDWYQCSRPLLFDQKSGKCYWAWSRGICDAGEWYVFGERMLPICQKNPCPEFPTTDTPSTDFYFQSPQDSKCYQAGTKGYCKYPNERLLTYPTQPIPECRNSTVCYPLSIPPPQLCIQGSRWHQNIISNCSF